MRSGAVLRREGRPSPCPRRVAAFALGATIAALTAVVASSIRYEVTGESMRPSLLPGDYLLANRVWPRLRAPHSGAIVVVRDPELPERELVKRVAERRGAAFIVLGDNAAASRDSRSFGAVSREAIAGRVWFRYWPPRRIGRPG